MASTPLSSAPDRASAARPDRLQARRRAETEQWVAFGTEYRALVDLPGIDNAKVWEPAPARVYRWELH